MGQWQSVSGDLPARSVTSIAVNSTDTSSQMAVVSYGGYASSTPDQPGHIYATLDGGRQWANITGNLPNQPVQQVDITQRGELHIWAKVADRWYIINTQNHWTQQVSSPID